MRRIKSVAAPMMAMFGLGLCLPVGGQALQSKDTAHGNLLAKTSNWLKSGSGTIKAEAGRLSLEVDDKWVCAYLESVVVPRNTGLIRYSCALSGNARIVIQFDGDLYGEHNGKSRHFSPAWGVDIQGTVERPIDPRAFNTSLGLPVKLSISVQGPKGAKATFTSIEFRPYSWPSSPKIDGQKSIRGIDLMPYLPQPYKMLDWKQVCRNFDKLTFDTKATGPYLPLCAVDDSDQLTFSQATYIGDTRVKDRAGESLVSFWAIISATVSGINKHNGNGADWVEMANTWFCRNRGMNLLTDYRNGPTAHNFWYDLQPTTAYAMIMDLYPGRSNSDAIFRASVDTLAKVHDSLKDSDGVPNYDFSGYDHDKMQPEVGGSKEPDNAGNAAWVFYMAYRRYGDKQYLNRALECFKFWDRYGKVPNVETGLSLGALTAVRINAELGMNLPADRYVQRCFEFSHEKDDHVVIGADRWGVNDVSGGWEDPANKIYYYESCAWTVLVNIARYDPAYARAMGKWMLNLANTLRLFFPDQLTPDQQTDWDWNGDPCHCIPYERLNWGRKGKWLYGASDAIDYDWPCKDLSLYSGAMSGFIAGRVDKTNVEGILKIDLLCLDTFHDKAYPTWLFYNPHTTRKVVELHLANRPVDLYDATSKKFTARGAKRSAKITIEPDRAVVVVETPANGKVTRQGHKMLINGVVVDYRNTR